MSNLAGRKMTIFPLRKMVDPAVIRAAAEKIARADYLLVATGAGFSADSGLPVYMDIATVDAYKKMGVEYHDLCDPCWIQDDLAVFYGFWGDCFNMYRDVTPHAGYEILQRWKARLCDKDSTTLAAIMESADMGTATTEPFFSYTSNVDAHFSHFFRPNEIYEIHGNTEHWQCSSGSCAKIWQLPSDFRFPINKETMLAEGTDSIEFLQCEECGAPARPNILMFQDSTWLENNEDDERYREWLSAVFHSLNRDEDKRLVILEIGCGTRVPSVRIQSEHVLRMALRKTVHTFSSLGEYQVHLIRVNPVMEEDVYQWRSGKHASPILKIEDFGLATLKAIDDELDAMDT
ncbi:unnamed protein product [Aphanomyces euteiches]